jgi:hypothetical protein
VFASAQSGLCGVPLYFQKLLHGLCVGDGKLWKNSTLDVMFQQQLRPKAKAALHETLKVPALNAIFGRPNPEQSVSWEIGGMTLLEDMEGRGKAGTLT